jgi:integrase
MYAKASNKSPKGTVGIESFQGRIRLRLPRQLFDGKQKYLSLGLPDTILNRKAAEAKAKLIESDIALERFDHTLAKYGRQQPQLTVVESIQSQSPKIMKLWQQFFDSKRPGIKPKTVEKYENLAKLFAKLGDLRIEEALEVRQKLERLTTVSRMKDALMYLSAACKWGIKHKLVPSNPFEGMAQELPKHRYQADPKPSAFTEEERDRIIESFKGDQRKGMNYQHYAAFVEFLFGVGCRPSEAISDSLVLKGRLCKLGINEFIPKAVKITALVKLQYLLQFKLYCKRSNQRTVLLNLWYFLALMGTQLIIEIFLGGPGQP